MFTCISGWWTRVFLNGKIVQRWEVLSCCYATLMFQICSFFTMSFSFLFSSIERNEALGKENESQQKKEPKMGFLCVFLHPSSLTLLFFYPNEKSFHRCLYCTFFFMYYKQEFFMLYAGITPDVQMSPVLSVSINHTWRKRNGNGGRQVRARLFLSIYFFAGQSLALSY